MPEDTGPPSTLALPARAIAAQRSAARASWMSPAAASAKSLLYVSDAGTFEVYAYAFPSLALTGTLTGFNRPQGECSDRAGNVWITNTNSLNLLEYAHGGTNAIADLADPTGYPVGCAVNPATGDLAVTNLFDLSGGGGFSYTKMHAVPPDPTVTPRCTTAISTPTTIREISTSVDPRTAAPISSRCSSPAVRRFRTSR